MLASDARLVTDGGGKAQAALNVIEGADRVAAFLVGAVRKGWTDDDVGALRHGQRPAGADRESARGLVQTNAFEIRRGRHGDLRGPESRQAETPLPLVTAAAYRQSFLPPKHFSLANVKGSVPAHLRFH